jgi:hypothetical protein
MWYQMVGQLANIEFKRIWNEMLMENLGIASVLIEIQTTAS